MLSKLLEDDEVDVNCTDLADVCTKICIFKIYSISLKCTPFLYCCALNSVECAKILIKHPQIDPNKCATGGFSKNHIELVLQNSNEEMLDFLLENEKIKITPIYFVSCS